MIVELPRLEGREPGPPDEPGVSFSDNRDHPMRRVTESVVDDPGSWTADQAATVAAVFDGLADGWNERIAGAGHLVPLLDALDRGAVTRGRVVDVGSGTGVATALLAARFVGVTAVDLSFEMLRRAPAAGAGRVQADAARLPLPAGCADAVVLVNAFLFPDEADRVLALGGAIVWVNSIGSRTPIHLTADRVEAALPGAWEGVASEAGEGTWCVLRRSASRASF